MMSQGNAGTYVYSKEKQEWVKVSDSARGLPDTYFKGEYFEPHFGTQGQPFGQHVSSRRDKARIMKQLGISERGDKYHGAR